MRAPAETVCKYLVERETIWKFSDIFFAPLFKRKRMNWNQNGTPLAGKLHKQISTQTLSQQPGLALTLKLLKKFPS